MSKYQSLKVHCLSKGVVKYESYFLSKFVSYSLAMAGLSTDKTYGHYNYLPPVFENGGRYCFGVRRRLRRLRRCFALYLGCY